MILKFSEKSTGIYDQICPNDKSSRSDELPMLRSQDCGLIKTTVLPDTRPNTGPTIVSVVKARKKCDGRPEQPNSLI